MATLTHRPPAEPTPFVGRARELAELSRALEAGRDGHGQFVLLRADAGMGKTRLCQEASRLASALGFTWLGGHCLEGDGTVAYLPFVELLEAAALHVPPEVLRDALANVGPELAVLAPQLRAVLPADVATRADLAGDHRHALFAALRDFFDRLSRTQPLLLIIEDIHWADPSTAVLLRHLVRFVSARHLVIVATCRPPDVVASDGGADAELLVSDVQRERAGSNVQLDELTLDDVMSLIQAMSGREPPLLIGQALLARTGGNPLFVEQVVKHLSEEGRVLDERGRWVEMTSLDELPIPESVRIVIERRLRHIDDDCRRMLTTAAVGGRVIDYELLSLVVGLDAGTFLEAIENASRARLVSVDRSGSRLAVTFGHDLIRQALLHAVSLPRRQQLHLEIAQAIERLFENAGGDRDAELAQHYLQARSTPDVEKTLRYVTAAAERALSATAYEEAARMYAEALDLVPASDAVRRCELLLRCGEARKRVSDSDEARATFAAAAQIARQTGDASQLARAALGFARSWPTVSSVDADAVALLSAALAAVPAEDLALHARLMSRHALQMLYCGSPDEVTRLARDAVDASRRCGEAMTLARALQVLHVALWQPSHLHERLALATEIVELSREIGDASVALWGIRPRIADLMELGDVAAAEAEIDAYERGAAATRQPIYLWQAAVRRAMITIFHGQLDEGERLAQRALDLGRQAEGQNLITAFGGQLLVVRWLQGRVAELKPLIAASRESQPRVKLWAAVLAFIEAEAGKPADARALFDELAADRFAGLPDEDTRLVVIALLSLTCAALGDGIRAEQLYELLLPYEGRNIVVSEGVASAGAASHYLGILAATARRRDDAERHFEDAIALSAATGGRPWLAQSQHEFARMLLSRRDAGDRRRASDLLRASLGIARDLGMQGLQDKIERLRRSHRRLAPDDPNGLTRREQEVLGLIARGRSTREISEELVLSERTSARHITNIYAKIGARNRVEATAFALRHGLAG